MSLLLGKNLVKKCFDKKLALFQSHLDKQRDNLIYYLLFLRVTPLLPNWFINIASPILNVPLSKFALATFIGLMPMNVVHVKTGLMLNDLQSVGGVDLKVRIQSLLNSRNSIDSGSPLWNRLPCPFTDLFQEEAGREV